VNKLIVEADGGSRGNPGISAGGAVVIDAETGEILAEVGVFIGVATNNVAEYSGLIGGLRKAREIDPAASIHVRMDSKLVVEQLSGRWKIKHPDMRELAREAHDIIAGTDVTFEWIAREFNSRADAVANESMDRRESFG
jgi:probable phosphoglycerate mutase